MLLGTHVDRFEEQSSEGCGLGKCVKGRRVAGGVILLDDKLTI